MTSFKIATEKGPVDKPCRVMWLTLGDRRHKFAAHDGTLSDYRSGYKFGCLNSIKVERMARISTYTRTSDRQAAAILVARMVDKIGADKVRATMAEKPTLNT